ncbi:MAG: hypothetical protein P8188_13030 [Gemmatimonadota bacterium]
MPATDFSTLPDTARLWVFPVQDTLDADEVDLLLGAVDSFLEGWAAHGAPLTGAREWVEDRFLLVAVDPSTVPPSGCSIDSMVRALRAVETRTGKRIVGHGPLYLRGEDGSVTRLSRPEFRDAARAGRITRETPVFDTTLTSLADYRAGRFERAAGESWHGPAFFS